LSLVTYVLAVVGWGLYVGGSVGWAQMLRVLASGTAGALVIAMIDDS
jgi:zinc transporter ZupT